MPGVGEQISLNRAPVATSGVVVGLVVRVLPKSPARQH